jgi:hypothetical protein
MLDHIAQECHKRKPKRTDTRPPPQHTWAHIVQTRAQNSPNTAPIYLLDRTNTDNGKIELLQTGNPGGEDTALQVSPIPETGTNTIVKGVENIIPQTNTMTEKC